MWAMEDTSASPDMRIVRLCKKRNNLGALLGIAHQNKAKAEDGRTPHVIRHVANGKM